MLYCGFEVGVYGETLVYVKKTHVVMVLVVLSARFAFGTWLS